MRQLISLFLSQRYYTFPSLVQGGGGGEVLPLPAFGPGMVGTSEYVGPGMVGARGHGTRDGGDQSQEGGRARGKIRTAYERARVGTRAASPEDMRKG